MTIFLATGLTAGEQHQMDDERIECRWFTKRDLRDLVLGGKIVDGKTLIGYFLWLESRKKRA